MLTALTLAGDSDETEILARARAGDRAAVATLYAHHREAAVRLATVLAGPSNAEDLVEDAFERVMSRLRRGSGPTSNFRAYLATTIRNRQRDLQRTEHELPLSDQPWLFDELRADEAPRPGDDLRSELAFAALPDTWQQVLRLVEVEGCSVTDTACRLGLNPAAVSSLAYRAREGLRTAYLDQCLDQCLVQDHCPVVTSECTWVRERLSRYVRAALGDAAASRTALHLRTCAPCQSLVTDLARVNRRFRFGRSEVSGVRAGRPDAAGGTTSSARARHRR